MSEPNDHEGLRAQAAADGAAATTQEQLRDDEAWAVQMRNGNASAAQIEANARLLDAQAEQAKSKAAVRVEIAKVIGLVTGLLFVAAVALAVYLVVKAFR